MISTTFDVSNATRPEDVLDCMISPARSYEFAELDEAAREAAILAGIRDHLDDPSLIPQALFVGNWHDEAPACGAFGWTLAPGYFADHYEAFRTRPSSGIHLAGTEQADAFPGYVEGAIRSGRAAAERVLAAMARA